VKLSELFEGEVTAHQLHGVETFADHLWGKLGIDVHFTKHFIDRMNDDRNGKQISAAELIRLFKKEYEKYGKDVKQIDAEAEAVFMDLLTDINLPFVMKHTKHGQELVAKTIMRKKDFKSDDPAYQVK
jgi:hypothetical protein